MGIIGPRRFEPTAGDRNGKTRGLGFQWPEIKIDESTICIY